MHVPGTWESGLVGALPYALIGAAKPSKLAVPLSRYPKGIRKGVRSMKPTSSIGLEGGGSMEGKRGVCWKLELLKRELQPPSPLIQNWRDSRKESSSMQSDMLPVK
ncbi:MAG: hypothetical protein Q9228_001988 [Teloschistes exilis]